MPMSHLLAVAGMKQIATLLLVGLLVFAAGCGEDEGGETTAAAATDEGAAVAEDKASEDSAGNGRVYWLSAVTKGLHYFGIDFFTRSLAGPSGLPKADTTGELKLRAVGRRVSSDRRRPAARCRARAGTRSPDRGDGSRCR